MEDEEEGDERGLGPQVEAHGLPKVREQTAALPKGLSETGREQCEWSRSYMCSQGGGRVMCGADLCQPCQVVVRDHHRGRRPVCV